MFKSLTLTCSFFFSSHSLLHFLICGKTTWTVCGLHHSCIIFNNVGKKFLMLKVKCRNFKVLQGCTVKFWSFFFVQTTVVLISKDLHCETVILQLLINNKSCLKNKCLCNIKICFGTCLLIYVLVNVCAILCMNTSRFICTHGMHVCSLSD